MKYLQKNKDKSAPLHGGLLGVLYFKLNSQMYNELCMLHNRLNKRLYTKLRINLNSRLYRQFINSQLGII